MIGNMGLNKVQTEIVCLFDEILLNGGFLKEELANCLGISSEDINGLLMNEYELQQIPTWLGQLRDMGRTTSLC